MQALELGITTVKFFPANIYGGLKALKALSAPFPQVRFIPTGGASVAEKLMKRYPLKGATLTLRTNLSASDNDFGAMLCNGETTVFSRKYRMHIADRAGGDGSGRVRR